MRRYDILFGSLLVLSTIDFALAAPVLVQEKRQAYADVVHTPKDARTMLRKRVGEDDLAKLAEYLETWGKPIKSSDTHASSSSMPPVPDRGSTSAMQGSASNPASSTGNLGPLMEPPIQSWAASTPWDPFKVPSDHSLGFVDSPESSPLSSGYSSDNEETESWPKVPKSKPVWIPKPSPDADPNFDWHYWMTVESPPRQRLASPKAGPSNSGPSNPGLSTGLDWDHNVNTPSPYVPPKIYSHSDPGSSPLSYSPRPTKFYSYSEPGSPLPYASSPTKFYNSPGPVAWSTAGTGSPIELEYGVSTPESPKESEYEVVHPPSPKAGTSKQAASPDAETPIEPQDQSLSPGSQPLTPQEVAYLLKGKAKVLRRVSGTARDVGNAAEREWQ
jgi:hypothetical protein